MKCFFTSCVFFCYTMQCIICDNDGVGIFREDSADIAMSNCTVERNGLSPMKEEEAASSPKPTLIAN